FSVAKMNLAAVPGPFTRNSFAFVFPTIPVGDEVPVCPGGTGIVKTDGSAAPVPSYNVATPVPLSLTQKGPPGRTTMPQGLTRWASVWAAGTAPSETRLLVEKDPTIGVGVGVGDTTLSTVEPLTPRRLALIVVVPGAMPMAIPVGSIVATDGFADAQVTWL